MEEKKGRIEEAAKQLFIKQGFHATSMRNIAEALREERAVSLEFEYTIEDRPQRYAVLPADADAVKSYIAARAA